MESAQWYSICWRYIYSQNNWTHVQLLWRMIQTSKIYDEVSHCSCIAVTRVTDAVEEVQSYEKPVTSKTRTAILDSKR